MVVLITGASHTGKTLQAQRLMEKCGWPYLSIDLLKMGLIRSGNTALTPEDDTELTEYLWPIVREMIRTALENQQNLIVEGCYISFDWAKGFSEADQREICYICLVMSRRYIEQHFTEIRENANVIEHRQEDNGCTIERVLTDNQYYLEMCRRYRYRYILIDEEYPEDITLSVPDMSKYCSGER